MESNHVVRPERFLSGRISDFASYRAIAQCGNISEREFVFAQFPNTVI